MLLVRNAISKSVGLNVLVLNRVSLRTYVNVAHSCLEVCVECYRFLLLGCYFCGVMGNGLFCKMFWMPLSSCLYSCLRSS